MGAEVDADTLADLISIPLFTGVIGYVTNWTGVLMLFRPLRFHGVRVPGLRLLFPLLPRRVQVLPLIRYDGRFGWQGIVPSRADKMASIAVDKGLLKLGSIRDFYRELDPDAIAAHLAAVAQADIRGIVDHIMLRENPQMWRGLSPLLKEAVYARVRGQLPKIVKSITDEIGRNVEQLIDAKLMIIRYFVAHPELLSELFLLMGRKELRFMQNFGFYFGVPMGIVLFDVVQAFPDWYVLPVGGVIIGWVVNYIGVQMIFAPIRPTRFLPWRQGLLIKRQPEVTELYAEMVADKVITLQNIGDELMTGPRSDRTRRLLEDSLRPAVDLAVGPARTAVKTAIGSRQYEQLRTSVAVGASELAPFAFSDVTFSKRQSNRVRSFISAQMRQLEAADFVDMFRSAIKQDEWLLFFHGGALGLFAGLLHLAIFGV